MIITSEFEIIDRLLIGGFFVGWPNPPSSETLRNLLKRSLYRAIAVEDNRLIGYATGLSDGVLFSTITSLEVLPEFQGVGLGKQLVEHLLSELPRVYAVDLICDPAVQPFYEKCGFTPYFGAVVRRRELLDV